MAQMVGAERGRELCCLTKLRNDLTNAAFGQRSTLTEKEMPIWPTTPRSNCFSPDRRPLSPVFSQVLAVVEICIEWLACSLNQRDLATFESLTPSNDEQTAPGSYLDVGDLECCDFRDA